MWKQKSSTDYHLVIVGPLGWKYARIVKKIQESESVMHLGYVAEDDKPALYAMAEIFAYMSFYEGFGLPVLEAMNCSTLVAMSNNSSLCEITQGKGFEVLPWDCGAIAGVLQDCFGLSEEEKGKKRKEGKEIAKKFSWDDAIKQFIHIIK